MKLDNKVYDVLKWVAQYLLPGLGTLYFAISGIWGLPYGEQIVGTITAIDAFLGMMLGLSGAKYPGDGTLKIDQTDPSKDVYRLDLNIPIEELAGKKAITLVVDPKASLDVEGV